MIDLKIPHYQDPDYVQGQIASLRALILALAQTTDPQTFKECALQRLELLRTAFLDMPIDDLRLQAVDECETWVKNAL